MTMQAADYVKIGKKLYTLIDVEKGKQIITCADFLMPIHSDEILISSACWRGYAAEYYIVRNTLYGVKKKEITKKTIKSARTIIPYTGSCIIAYGDGWNSDFLDSYIDYDEAHELYFEKGILKEKLSLISAIEKARALSDTDEYKNKMKPYERTNIRKKIARKPLKYKYDNSTYKWRKKNR